MSTKTVTDKVKLLLRSFEQMQEQYMERYALLTALKDSAKEGELTSEELVDIGYLCREIGKLADEMRKEADAKMALFGAKLAESMLNSLVAGDGSAEDSVKGALASGRPGLKQRVRLPAKETEEYMKLLAHYRIPFENRHLLRLHYPTIRDEATEAAKRGENPPPGVQIGVPEFYCTYRKLRTNAT